MKIKTFIFGWKKIIISIIFFILIMCLLSSPLGIKNSERRTISFLKEVFLIDTEK